MCIEYSMYCTASSSSQNENDGREQLHRTRVLSEKEDADRVLLGKVSSGESLKTTSLQSRRRVQSLCNDEGLQLLFGVRFDFFFLTLSRCCSRHTRLPPSNATACACPLKSRSFRTACRVPIMQLLLRLACGCIWPIHAYGMPISDEHSDRDAHAYASSNLQRRRWI